MDSTVVEVRTGGQEAVHDLTAECAGFLASVGAGDGLLHVWVPHATAGLAVLETGAGSDDDLLAALRELLPAGRPVAAPARLARARPRPRAAGAVPAVRHRPGPGRPDGARHLAVGLPGRPQRRQPGAAGPAVFLSG